jgi:hypothetical protein
MGIVAPPFNCTHIILSFTLFFKIILMTCLPPLFGSGGFEQLGVSAITKLLGKTGDGSIFYHLLFISDVPALCSSAQVHFILLTPFICSHLAVAFLDASKNLPFRLSLIPRFFCVGQPSAHI